ncbi:NTF2-related export protein-like [Contarinia nasturtii]|uniref:NTF2-related export protein-like n=1 Tax=Contarinia nasturtii TaxID=265458 RepID=UPI0012D3A78A|nr:NTF2-related export protein-like [Contarinia nasturtii]
MNAEFRSKVEESSRTAEDFTKLYYESLDKKRHQMSRLYLDNAIAIWNGNGTTGKENIQKFFQDLPITEHTITTLDAQPVIDEALSNQKTLLIMVSGMFRIQNNQSKQFQQTFIITAHEEKWKIVSDCFRIQDALSTIDKK